MEPCDLSQTLPFAEQPGKTNRPASQPRPFEIGLGGVARFSLRQRLADIGTGVHGEAHVSTPVLPDADVAEYQPVDPTQRPENVLSPDPFLSADGSGQVFVHRVLVGRVDVKQTRLVIVIDHKEMPQPVDDDLAAPPFDRIFPADHEEQQVGLRIHPCRMHDDGRLEPFWNDFGVKVLQRYTIVLNFGRRMFLDILRPATSSSSPISACDSLRNSTSSACSLAAFELCSLSSTFQSALSL
jgi:hypothetical protein